MFYVTVYAFKSVIILGQTRAVNYLERNRIVSTVLWLFTYYTEYIGLALAADIICLDN